MTDAFFGLSPAAPGGPVLTPPGPTAAAPLAAGHRIAGRYRLVRPVISANHRPPASPPGAAKRATGDARLDTEPAPPVLWLAHDEVLARPVAAKLLPTGGRRDEADVQAFLTAAGAAGAVSHPVLVRVYDAAVEFVQEEDTGPIAGTAYVTTTGPHEPARLGARAGTAYVISEWVDGPTLADVLLADGPWEPERARALVTELLDALAVVHDAGLAHGGVHPGNLLLAPDGSVRLTDVGTSAALPERTVPASRASDPDPQSADVRDLAALLYALLTGRWPTSGTPQRSGGLPSAPVGRDGPSRGRLTGPSQIRAGVPRALDAVVVRALDPDRAAQSPDLTTPAGLCDALGGTPAPPPRSRPARTRRPRRRLRLVLALMGLSVLGAAAYALATSLDPMGPSDLPGRDRPRVPSPAVATALDLGAVPVRDFDPKPGDGRERSATVPNAIDDDAGTVWETERYSNGQFGGLKGGVGLLLDLGVPTTLARVEVDLTAPGTTVELRAAEPPTSTGAPEGIEAYRVLATEVSGAAPTTLTPAAGAPGRFYLVWISGLPQSDGRFSAGISSLRFFRT